MVVESVAQDTKLTDGTGKNLVYVPLKDRYKKPIIVPQLLKIIGCVINNLACVTQPLKRIVNMLVWCDNPHTKASEVPSYDG